MGDPMAVNGGNGGDIRGEARADLAAIHARVLHPIVFGRVLTVTQACLAKRRSSV
jgi:hypothetical protein